MKRFNILICTLALVMLSCQGQSQTAKVVTMYELPAPLKDRPEQILYKTGFTISYNRETKTPNWVAWHLTDNHTKGPHQRKQEVFSEDPEVKTPRATNNDYYNSRYDRGHMCPAGDNKWSSESMRESFLFTNICPQNHGLNKYEWNDLEILCRDWARKYGSLDIVCGPIFRTPGDGSSRTLGDGSFLCENESASKARTKKNRPQVCESPRTKKNRPQVCETIGKNKVWVPIAFFKVVLCRKGNNPKAIGFIYRNEGVKQPMEDAVYTVDEIEQLTGIDFFPSLDDALEDRIEARARLTDW